ncbi:pectate lyase [Paucibacter sp. B2R-40]|uniref:pectate lyase n=1 Tax=Paucibacter sp. B2R-40 TaxID=2893554 RepID=UPI0021E3A929|nr:pectate lyase [Paucibacter sp. B2R-40]MCV2354313.1 pectate lyase [Paucibacter sp. B2R-40]
MSITFPSSRSRWTAALLLGLACAVQSAVIGVNAPVVPLTPERLGELESADLRRAWGQYLEHSAQQRAADKAALAAERAGSAATPAGPDGGNSEKSMPLNQPAAWYGSAQALLVANNIVSFQTPAGGWGKNQPRDRPVRLPGQDYVANSNSKHPTPGDFDQAMEPHWSYVGTIDNDATVTEIRFLAKVAAQLPPEQAAAFRQSLLKGLSYLFSAQFPNGAWPQVWPLQGGYHDAITLNDNAMVAVAELMGAVARGEQGFHGLPQRVQEQAALAERRAIESLLATQVSAHGRKLLWAQQYDALSLAPVSARNYEPAALSSAESAQVLIYLMSLPQPSPAVVQAVEAGIAALRAIAIEGMVWGKVDEAQGRRLRPRAGAAQLWARYYDIQTLKPVFGDRDKSLHDDVDDISLERRNGYAWYGTGPAKALAAYAEWLKSCCAPPQAQQSHDIRRSDGRLQQAASDRADP